MKRTLPQAGFTFIELILYLALLTLIAGSIVQFGLLTLHNSEKSGIQETVSDSARFLSEKLKYEIRNADGIVAITPTALTLATATPATNPTVIDLASGIVRIQQGSGTPVALTPTDVSATALTFTNSSSGDSKTQHIEYGFTLTQETATSVRALFWSATASGSAEVRSNPLSKDNYDY